MRRVDSLEKTDAGRDWGQEEKGTTENEMVGWHHRLDGRESEWTLGVGDGQGGLAWCDSWSRKESDTTERLNWTELSWYLTSISSGYGLSLFLRNGLGPNLKNLNCLPVGNSLLSMVGCSLCVEEQHGHQTSHCLCRDLVTELTLPVTSHCPADP